MDGTRQTVTEVGDTAVTYDGAGEPLIEEMRVEVCVVEGADRELASLVPDDGLVVGTHPKAGLRLKDPTVSRQHTQLWAEPGGVRVRDLDSTNGTFVGGTRITEAVVPLGSTVALGETRLELRRLVDRYPLPISRRRRLDDLIGSSAAMRRVYALLERAAEVDATVLIEGETGTGKELAARAIHRHSPRARGPLHIVDCGAVSPTLIEAELFGHVKGSFTGADRDRAGAFESAHGGTLFFDEIGELPLNLQPKLLRVLETREVQRVGGSERSRVDVRFVAATNRDLAVEVQRGRFREDLYFRLNVFRIVMPPLRERRDDVPQLVQHFLGPLGGARLPDELMVRLQQDDWPGNVRELRNAVERAVILARGHSLADAGGDAEDRSSERPPVDPERMFVDASRPFKEVKAELVSAFERSYIEQVLRRTGGNISAAARESGVDRKHLERLIRKHDIDQPA